MNPIPMPTKTAISTRFGKYPRFQIVPARYRISASSRNRVTNPMKKSLHPSADHAVANGAGAVAALPSVSGRSLGR
jgi:hypothetical protein